MSHKKEYRLRGHDGTYLHEIHEFEDSLTLSESLELARDTEPVETLALGDEASFGIEVYEGDAVSLTDSSLINDAARESRVGYARIGFSEVGA